VELPCPLSIPADAAVSFQKTRYLRIRRSCPAFLLLGPLASCGGDAPAGKSSASQADAPGIAGALVDVAAREAAGIRPKPLATPLPGDVLVRQDLSAGFDTSAVTQEKATSTPQVFRRVAGERVSTRTSD